MGTGSVGLGMVWENPTRGLPSHQTLISITLSMVSYKDLCSSVHINQVLLMV